MLREIGPWRPRPEWIAESKRRVMDRAQHGLDLSSDAGRNPAGSD